MKNKIFTLIVTYIFILLCFTSNVSANFNIVVNDTRLDAQPVNIDGRLYIPIRAVSESLGAQVEWDAETSTAYITQPNTEEEATIKMISDISKSVVAIVGNYKSDVNSKVTSTAHGSGVIIKAGGEILTNAHVVKDLEQIIVVMNDGTGYEAKLKYMDEEIDLAVIKINKIGLPAIRFADESSIITGTTAVAIGTPVSFSLRNSASKGIISGINCNAFSNYRLIQTDTAINPGNSGGPLVNLRGELMGINSSKFVAESVEGVGFAIPVDTVKYALRHFETYGEIKRVSTGISYDESWAASIGLPTREGLTVKNVLQDSPAQKCGILPGDIITNIGKKEIHNRIDYTEALKEYIPGDLIEITILRNNVPIIIYMAV